MLIFGVSVALVVVAAAVGSVLADLRRSRFYRDYLHRKKSPATESRRK